MRESDERLGREALDILARATINQLKEDAAELAALFADLDADERERLAALMFGETGL